MKYKGKACEIIGEKEVFGQRIALFDKLTCHSLI